MRKKRIPALILMALLCVSCVSPAFALEYNYASQAPGQKFYQATSVDSEYIESSDLITVGDDGTIVSGTELPADYVPMSTLTLPVGDYPDSWGNATDVAIAQNSIFPNYLAPTTQQSYVTGYAVPDFIKITSGALPTNYYYYNALGYGYNYLGYNYWAVMGEHMPKLTEGGAIARLTIPSCGIDRWVYEGTEQSSLSRGVGHFTCSPAWGGNICLAGHNNPSQRAFHNLKNIKVGDTITYTTGYGALTYVVSSITDVSVYDTTGLLQDGTNKLTMYTCREGNPSVKMCVVATLVG